MGEGADQIDPLPVKPTFQKLSLIRAKDVFYKRHNNCSHICCMQVEDEYMSMRCSVTDLKIETALIPHLVEWWS